MLSVCPAFQHPANFYTIWYEHDNNESFQILVLLISYNWFHSIADLQTYEEEKH
jgi:hypothetical protein